MWATLCACRDQASSILGYYYHRRPYKHSTYSEVYIIDRCIEKKCKRNSAFKTAGILVMQTNDNLEMHVHVIVTRFERHRVFGNGGRIKVSDPTSTAPEYRVCGTWVEVDASARSANRIQANAAHCRMKHRSVVRCSRKEKKQAG